MTTFKFHFSGIEENKPTPEQNEDIQWYESEEIFITHQLKELDNLIIQAKMFTCDEVEIGYVTQCNLSAAKKENKMNVIELAEKEHTDLVTGKYEGGLKVWECTSDLIQYLLKNEDKINLVSTKVLDLGCGVGILGIYALQNGSFVTFQDYNKEVIENITIPSVLLNIEEEDREKELNRCKFYSGDWATFDKKLNKSEVYDIIVTSETIYNDSNYEKLTSLFLNRLGPNGTIYVAAKTYYFGVGGGTRQFEQHIEKAGLLKSKTVWTSFGGVQREILKINRS